MLVSKDLIGKKTSVKSVLIRKIGVYPRVCMGATSGEVNVGVAAARSDAVTVTNERLLRSPVGQQPPLGVSS